MEALDRTVCRTRFGRFCGPFGKTDYRMNKWKKSLFHIFMCYSLCHLLVCWRQFIDKKDESETSSVVAMPLGNLPCEIRISRLLKIFMNFKRISKHSSIMAIQIPIKCSKLQKLCGVYFRNICNKVSVSSSENQVLASSMKSCSQEYDAADKKNSDKYSICCQRDYVWNWQPEEYSTARDSQLAFRGSSVILLTRAAIEWQV